MSLWLWVSLESMVLGLSVKSLVTSMVQAGLGKGTLPYAHASVPASVCCLCQNLTMSAHPCASDGIRTSFSDDANQEKTAGKCEKDGTRHLPTYVSFLCQLLFCMKANTESRKWLYPLSFPKTDLWVPGS